MLADMSHNLMVFRYMGALLRNNDCFNLSFFSYLMLIMLVTILTPSSTLIILAGEAQNLGIVSPVVHPVRVTG